MKPDWSLVTRKHVEEAFDQFDSQALNPKQPARSTFLELNGKKYPAKFIRGLAYKVATGVDLPLHGVYWGGLETKKFFENLNFQVDYRGPGK